MSIWCSHPTIGWDDEGESVGGKVIDDGGERNPQPHWEGGEVRSYADGWSNHYPDGSAEHPASVDLASIPTWCVPGHADDEGTYEFPYGPWLRLSVNSPNAVTYWHERGGAQGPLPAPEHATVVMDEAAVRALHAQLGAWLEAPKVYPAVTGDERA